MNLDRMWIIQNLTTLTVIGLMLAVGLNVTISEIVRAVKQKGLLTRALLVNLGLVPALVVGLVMVFEVPAEIALGMIISAAAPGAPLGPPLSIMARGDLPFAVGLMAVLAGLSVVVTPLLSRMALVSVSAGGEIDFAVMSIVKTVFETMLIPLAIGIAINHWRPTAAQRIAKPLRLVSNVLLLITIALIIVGQFHFFIEWDWSVIAAMVLGVVLPLVLGYAFGGPGYPTRRSLAITAGVRNTGLALLIATSSFASTAAVTSVTVYGLLMVLGGLLYAMASGRASMLCGANRQNAQTSLVIARPK